MKNFLQNGLTLASWGAIFFLGKGSYTHFLQVSLQNILCSVTRGHKKERNRIGNR